ncbi:universal stress protein [Kushneria aurantia]|uniref:Universal stress protein n=1 Tax=Kushneria aurantia TaxID=504092 RepID=A0ABV6FZE3_9GAMM|nr:universal stress protein [Kushneria aurantia]
MDRIVACFDEGAGADSAIGDYAAWAAERLRAPLTLLHVLERHSPPGGNYSGQIGPGSREQLLEKMTEEDAREARRARDERREMLEALKARLGQEGPGITTEQRLGELAPELAEICSAHDLVVVGRCGHQHEQQASQGVIGDHLEELAQHLPSPLLVAPSTFRAPARVMVAFDGSERGLEQIAALGEQGWLRDVECHLVHVAEPPDESGVRRAAELLQEKGIAAQSVSLEGDVRRKLPGYVAEHDIDLTVMGAYGHGSLVRWLKGSTTRRLLESIHSAILLMR